jgi:death-on-curing protein
MITYLDLEDALYVIQRLGFYVKDVGLLDSALARPKTTVFGEDAYPSLSLKAAALAHSIAKNHALVDGNKRTTWALMVSFLIVNGFKHNFTTEKGMNFVLDLATDKLSLENAAELIEQHLIPWS